MINVTTPLMPEATTAPTTAAAKVGVSEDVIIAGVIVASVAVVALVLVVLYIRLKKRRLQYHLAARTCSKTVRLQKLLPFEDKSLDDKSCISRPRARENFPTELSASLSPFDTFDDTFEDQNSDCRFVSRYTTLPREREHDDQDGRMTHLSLTGSPPTVPTVDGNTPGLFVSQTVGLEGGDISLLGVKLHVPNGALTGPTVMRLGILRSVQHLPVLAKMEATLSPIVVCEPHGYQLQQDATLTMPHCIDDISTAWQVTVWASHTHIHDAPQWTRFAGSTEFLNNHISLKLKNFTLYTASGTPVAPVAAKKRVELVAFAPPLRGNQLPIRIYCLNDYTDHGAKDTKEMIESEKRLGGQQATTLVKLPFYNDKKSLFVESDLISQPWRLSPMCKPKEEIVFDHVWQGIGDNCTFIMKSDETPKDIECSFTGYQGNHEEDKRSLVISAERQESLVLAHTEELLVNKVFPAGLSRILVTLLDPDLAVGNNWVAIAERLKLPMQEVFWLEDEHRKNKRSPTRYLLNIWARDNTLHEFIAAMTQLERYDVVDDIKTWIEQRDVQQSEHTEDVSIDL